MKKQIILIIFLLTLLGCSKKVYVADKTETQTRDSTKVEQEKKSDITSIISVSDSSEVEITYFLPPDSLGKQYIQKQEKVKIKRKTDVISNNVTTERKDSIKTIEKKEKKDILVKEKKNVLQYAPIAIFILIIVIINFYVRWRK